jgi:hypothetical protein
MIGDDPFPYGIKANKALIETITGYSHEQDLRGDKVEELFAEALDCGGGNVPCCR